TAVGINRYRVAYHRQQRCIGATVGIGIAICKLNTIRACESLNRIGLVAAPQHITIDIAGEHAICDSGLGTQHVVDTELPGSSTNLETHRCTCDDNGMPRAEVRS